MDSPPAPLTGQTLLFSREIEVATEQRRKAGRYTAEEIAQERPAVYEEIVARLITGELGLVKLAALYHVHHRTISAIELREQARIGDARQREVNRLRLGARLQLDRMIEHPDLVPIQFAAPAARQMLELAEVMSGGVSSRTEHVERVDIHADFLGFVDTLTSDAEKQKRERELGPGEVRELPGIGLSGGKFPPFSAGIAAEALEAEPSRTDRESDALPKVAEAEVTAFEPAHGPDPAAPDGSGGQPGRGAGGVE